MGVFNLFSGCGGCSLGLKQAGFEVNLAVDIDKDTCDTYSANLGKDVIWNVDLSKIEPHELLQRARLNLLELNLIVGGPPCQGFSSAGAKDWTDPRNALIRNFVEIITCLRPTWFIMENVEGFLTANDGVFVIETISQLLEAGYWVRAKKVYMEQHGLPQRRKRVIIVGNLEQRYFDFPEQTYLNQMPLPVLTQQVQLNILNAISDLPEPTDTGEARYDKEPLCDYQRKLRRIDGQPVRDHQIKMLNDAAQQRIKFIKQGETMKHLPQELQHPSFIRRSYRRVMDGTPTEKRGGAPSGIKRLKAYDPSLTITSASPTEFIHPYENRPLTIRECARIQSFPDWFKFKGSWSSIATQIGNAIPPMYMQLLATHIESLATWQRVDNPRGCWLGIDATKSEGKSPVLNKMLNNLEERTHAYAYS